MKVDKNSLKLMKKCEDEEIATQGMGACQVLLEEMDRGNIDREIFEGDDPDESYIQMAQRITPNDVPRVLDMAFKMRQEPNVSPEMKNAANRLIRAIEAL
ncbi:hypothetical protein [Methanobacterium sp. ACI-7]|uniref:hypothetical protein n=1 Tax=unclassified Methanobacterium TaxID=2627676 RepID=UPI0039C404A4